MSLFAPKQKGMSTVSPRLSAIQIQTSTYGVVIPVIFGTNRAQGNLIHCADFIAIPHTTETDSGGGKGGGGGGSTSNTTYTYTVAFAMAICEGPIAGIGKMWEAKNVHDSLLPALTLFTGTYPQDAWSYFTTESGGVLVNPDWKNLVAALIINWAATGSPVPLTQTYIEEVVYPGIAYVAASAFDLGDSNSLPNLGFEVKGLEIVAGTDDANPADIITAIITDGKFGLDLDPALLAIKGTHDFTDFYDYCMAADILISPVYNSQETAADIIKNICEMANSEIVWHDGAVIRIIPYGDSWITGYGVTWTPDLTVQYDLGDDDFICDADDDPVKVIRGTPADMFNSIKIEYCDRTKDYNISAEHYQDQGCIDRYGLRTSDTKTYHGITRQAVAQIVAKLLLNRTLYVRNQYEFTLGWKYCRLEPMDIVTINDSKLGLTAYPVRIISMEENDNGEWGVIADDLGIGNALTTWALSGGGYIADYNLNPGNVN